MATVNGSLTAAITTGASFFGTKVTTRGFPNKPLNIKVELLVNTTWTDITKYVMVRDDIVITGGRTDESSSINASSLALTLKNIDGRFSPDNSSGAYYPYIQLNTQIRLSISDASSNGTAYSGYRFWGEVSEWPPGWGPKGNDSYVTITASGIWRRLSQSTKIIGSPYTRFNNLLKTTYNLAGYWPMEDGEGSNFFATTVPATSANMAISGPPTNVPTLASVAGFLGSDALPTLNAAEFTANITSSSSPTTVQFRFCLFVPSGGDTGRGMSGGTIARLHTSGTAATVDVGFGTAVAGGPLTITGLNGSGTQIFSSSSATSIWGIPMLVIVNLTQVSTNIQWTMNTLLPGDTGWHTTTSGSVPGTVTDATSVIFNPGGTYSTVSVGQAAVYYGNPPIQNTSKALNAWVGENALTRFERLCGEQGIPYQSVGTTTTTLGPQVDDTLVNVLQSIEDTDGGLLYETSNAFGLGYRTMASLQNQSPVLSLNYTSAQIGQPLTPVMDDALTHNDVTLTNYDGYSVRVYLANGARSIQNPPNGVGTGYEYTRNVNATNHTQVNNLGIQLMNCGTVAKSRYPNATVNLARTTTASLFQTVPSMRQGDYFQLTNMPAIGGSATQKLLAWGRQETINNFTWTFIFNSIPEDPWESSFNPGTSATSQVPASPTTQGNGAGGTGTVTSASIQEGAIIGANIAQGAVQGGNIANASITATNIANATITGTLIGNGTITGANIASATISGSNIVNGTITGTQIATATVTGSNIGSGTITGTNIASATITGANIGNATVTGTNIAATTITATNIANATISTTQISATAGITGSQLASQTITAAQIANATITASQVADGTITGAKIAGGTITASNIQNATITNTQIAGGSITGSNIANNTITGANLVNATITSVQISNGTITTTQISNAAGITGTQIATGTVSGSNIAAGTVTASNIAAGTITGSLIAANTIAAGNLTAGIVVAGIVNGTVITAGTFVADGSTGQFLAYSGTPASGNLIGSWSGTSGTDAYGNAYPSGLSINQGVITGIDLDSVNITNCTLEGDILTGSTISNPVINGGSVTETNVTFDSVGGQLLVYTSTTTTTTFSTAGDATWTAPAGVTQAKVEVWGAGAGGDGGTTSVGGNGGGGGEYAAEPNYPVTPAQTYNLTVGAGGTGNNTSNGHGTDGGDTFFDGPGGVLGNGGNGNGTSGSGSANTTHHNGGAGGTSGSNAGGSSGGNSGNATAAGSNGVNATSSTGAAAPASQTGSGRGGAGGSSGANGSSATAPGGGGGGAGKGTTSSSKAVSYAPTWTGSYYGPDADASVNDTLRSTSVMYQGGATASGGSFNGNQRSVFAFNRTQIASDFAGYTITSCTLQLKNLHSWYSSGMTWTMDEYTGLGGSAPSTYPSASYHSTDASGTIAEGDTHIYSLPVSIAQRFITSNSNGLGIGATVHSAHPYDLHYYGYFDPSQIRFKIYGTISGAGNETAGNGGDGQVKITYVNGQTLLGAISPVAGSDSAANAFAAGWTGPVTALQPGSSPAALETWHNMTLSNGWTVGSGGHARYKLLPGNLVMISLNNVTPGTISDGTVIWVPPSGYASTVQQKLPLAATYSTAPGYGSMPFLYTNNSSGLEVFDLRGTINTIATCVTYALD